MDPTHRGKGVAKALAQHQLKTALALKPRSIRFATAEVNAESLHIARKQGFREIARFTYVEGPVRDEAASAQVQTVCGPGAAWEFIRSSSAYQAARGFLASGWRFPQLTSDRLTTLVAQGAVFAYGDPMKGLLIQLPDPYAPAVFAMVAFLHGDDAAQDSLLRFAHVRARERGQEYLAAMVSGEEKVDIFNRYGLVPLPYFRHVLVLAYPLP